MEKKKMSQKTKKRLVITTVVLILIAVIGICLLYNFGLTSIPFISELPDDEQIKIACVGDSVTYGYGLNDWEENNYPAVLQSMLGDNYHVMNFGVNGHCVQGTSDKPYTSSENYELSIGYNADIVIFMLGSNDSKIHNWQGTDHFREAYYKLLDDYANSKIILCTPATAFYIDETGEVARDDDDGLTTFDIQPKVIEEIADIVRSVAKERDLPLIDINDLTYGHPEWFTLDGTHPSEDGARAIAEAVYEELTK